MNKKVIGIMMLVFSILVMNINTNALARKDFTRVHIHKMLLTDENFDSHNTRISSFVEEIDGNKLDEGNYEKYFGEGSTEINGAYFIAYPEILRERELDNKYSEKTLFPDGRADLDKIKGYENYMIKNYPGSIVVIQTGSDKGVFNLRNAFKKWIIREVKELSEYKDGDGDKNAKILDRGLADILIIQTPYSTDKDTLSDVHLYPKNTEDRPYLSSSIKDGKTSVYSNSNMELIDSIDLPYRYMDYRKLKLTLKQEITSETDILDNSIEPESSTAPDLKSISISLNDGEYTNIDMSKISTNENKEKEIDLLELIKSAGLESNNKLNIKLKAEVLVPSVEGLNDDSNKKVLRLVSAVRYANNPDSAEKKGDESYTDADVSVIIENLQPSEMPVTGGIGALIFISSGIFLVSIALFGIVRSRRNEA